jgi:NADH-quinone oxidoreductase subunit J
VFANILFIILSVLGLAGGIGMIFSRNAIYSVLFLILNFFCIGGLFLTLHSEFLAVIQIIVYAGAIMVLFLFVIMLLNLSSEQQWDQQYDWKRILAVILGLGFFAQMLYVFSVVKQFDGRIAENFAYGKVETIGKDMMTTHLFPFEMISVILLAALMGAIIIAKKHKE